jgi:hypothetical protein
VLPRTLLIPVSSLPLLRLRPILTDSDGELAPLSPSPFLRQAPTEEEPLAKTASLLLKEASRTLPPTTPSSLPAPRWSLSA